MGVIRKKTASRGTDGGTKFHCDVCSVDITSTVRINCASPSCQDYDLCVPCFAEGASSKQHDPRTHPYYVIEQNSVPIFAPDWGADEELLLLEGAEIYGLGSWADIADHIGGYRSKDEVRDHYIETYIHSSKFPLPERADPADTRLQDEISKEEFQSRKKRRIEERKEAARIAQLTPASPKQKPTASVPACHEVQGYMPGRLEFDHEYLNEAEEGVQSMSFEPASVANLSKDGVLDAEMELKMTVKDIYISRLDERVKRKKIIFEHGLLDYRKNQALEKKKTKEERELLAKAKPFAQMMNHADFIEFTKALEYEHNLRIAIAQLQEWRNMGIADLKSGEVYEQDKAARLQRQALSHAGQFDRMNAQNRMKALALQQAHGHGHGHGHGQGNSGEGPTAAALMTAVNMPRGIIGGWGSTGVTEIKDDREREREKGGNKTSTAATATTATTATTTISSSSAAPAATADGASTASASASTDSKPPRPRTAIIQPIPNITPWDLEGSPPPSITGSSNSNNSNNNSGVTYTLPVPDLHLLTPEEITLCNVLHVQPKPYLVIKEHLIKEAMRNGGVLKRKDVKGVLGGRIDAAKGGRIWEFMVMSGWVAKG